MSREYLFTIQPDHVGKRMLLARGKTYCMGGVMGTVLARDVGKQVFLTNGVIQVENDEQRNARLGIEPDSKRKGDARQMDTRQRASLHELLWDYMLLDKERPWDRVRTGWGTKTFEGLVACIERIAYQPNTLPPKE